MAHTHHGETHEPASSLRTHYSSAVTEALDGQTITLAGWAHEIRDLGKLKFLVLRDREGRVQVTAKEGVADSLVIDSLKGVSRESVVVVVGNVVKNAKAPGGVEVVPSKITVIASAQSPLPLDVTGKVDADLDTRINNRFMDVRKPEVMAVFRIRAKVQEAFREFFLKKKFIEINPPSIIAAASEGGTNLFALTYFEKEAYLCQSPQLYKQMILAGGFDKVFMTVPVFRAESHNTTKHLNEIYQMDIEKAFIRDEEGVLEELEGVTYHIIKKVVEECPQELKALNRNLEVPKLPLPRVTYDECLEILNKKGMKMPWGEDLSSEACHLLKDEFTGPYIIKAWPTKVRAFYSRPYDDDPERCGAFDLMLGDLELCSGAQRIHDHDQLVAALKKRGLNPANFEFYLSAFKYGMPPHGGWSIGSERITQVLTGVPNIRETVLWPRDRTRLTP
ncbi:Aspartate--tRNA(Asp) ligase [uncultured archaeon]|nr:Aspartate--tRNA(Asp) ligase [uncultured archaeon]